MHAQNANFALKFPLKIRVFAPPHKFSTFLKKNLKQKIFRHVIPTAKNLGWAKFCPLYLP